MNLKEFLILNEANIITGVPVIFKEVETSKGSIMSFTTDVEDDDDTRYVIAASLDNYSRFEKWDGKKARADILPLNKKIRLSDGTARLAKIRVNVEVEKLPTEKKLNVDVDVDEKGETIF